MVLSCNDDIHLEGKFKYYLLNFCFLITPKYLTKVYIVLSLLVFIYSTNNKKYDEKILENEKLNKILYLSLNNDILMLPSFTFHWFWNERFLKKNIHVRNENMTIGNLIKNRELLLDNVGNFSDSVIENLPKFITYKLKLSKFENKLDLKHDIVRSLMYSL